MKLLILSCNTGGGHNSAAKAIKQAFEEKGHSCNIEDVLAFGGQKASDLVCDAYIEMVKKTPKLFGEIYKMGSKIGQLNQQKGIRSPVYYINKLYQDALESYIKENAYDAVVCVHIFAAEAMTNLKKHCRLTIPFYFVATDYYISPMLEETTPNAIFIAHPDSTFTYLNHGIAKKLLVPTGIPVSSQFTVKKDKNKIRSKLGLQAQDKVILLMSGSMGFGDLIDTTRYIFEKGDADTKVIAITGHNKKLYKELEKNFDGENRLKLLGFTEKVSDYMDASDVLLTKPGGLSSTEALAKGIAIVHTAPIPGCESENVQFFTEHHLSLCANDSMDAGRLAIKLLEDQFLRNQILAAQDNYRCHDSAGQICDFVLNAFNQSK